MIKYKDFINEGLFKKKTFDDRIEEIDKLIMSALKYRGMTLTRSKLDIIKPSNTNNFTYSIEDVSQKLKDVLTKCGSTIKQEEMDIFMNRFNSFRKMLRITFPIRFFDNVKNIAFNFNAIIQIIDYLKTKNLNIDYETIDKDGDIDLVSIVKDGKFSIYLNRQSMIDKNEKELKDKYKDIDPLGEENWDDVNEWNNYDEEDMEEENEIDDPELHVGDRVEILNYHNYNIDINDRGEIIRIFDGDRYVIDYGYGYKSYRIVVKFDNQRNLLASALSEYKDCYSFFVKYNMKKGTYNLPGKGETIIRKIN